MAAVAAAVVLAAVLLVGVAGHPGDHRTRDGLPAGLASERLFFAEAGRTGLYRADGTRIRTFPGLAGIGYIQPLRTAAGVLVYIHGNSAYETSGTDAPTPVQADVSTTQAPAKTWAIFPAVDGRIGIESAPLGDPTSVNFLTTDGRNLNPAPTPAAPPAGATVVGEVPSGLLIETHGAFSDPILGISSLHLSILEAQRTVLLGVTSSVIGIHGNSVAWTTCPAPRSTNCALELSDTSNGTVHAIAAPTPHTGYADSGGAFSPNGKLLAAFVPEQQPDGTEVLRLAVADVATGTVSVLDPTVPTKDLLSGTATWSADGHWLYFGGISGRLHAQQIGPDGPTGHSWTLPLATSGAVTGD